MIALTTPYLWYATRATGIVTMLLFTGVVALGTLVANRVGGTFISAVVPMTSAYKRIPVALGAVAFDLILAVWISSLLKLRIKNQTWRFLHWFSWLAYAISLVHGYLSGTDAHHGLGMALVIGCAGFVALAALWRFLGRPTRAAGRTALSPLASPSVPPRPRGPGAFPRTPPRPPSSRRR